MESEDIISRREKKQLNENDDYSCFGEYGSRTRCETCKNRGTCKSFTHEKQQAIYLKAKMKYHGKGKWRRKDLY